jgi:hypothetical protein
VFLARLAPFGLPPDPLQFGNLALKLFDALSEFVESFTHD